MRAFADYGAIKVGDRRSLARTITQEDIRAFVAMTGDDNPLHVDPGFAEATALKDVVVHGMLGASFLSTLIGTRLPGAGALWLSQSMDFLLPVRLGDSLEVSCEVVGKHDRDQVLDLEMEILNQHRQLVLAGAGKVKVLAPAEPVPAPAPSLEAAIVTGGSGGIGSAICRRLAEAGHPVVVNYLDRKDRAARLVEEIVRGGGRAIAARADVGSREGVEALAAMAADAFGGVGALVHNASSANIARPLAGMEWADFQGHLDVQLKAAFLLVKACLPAMVDRRQGRIVFITSQAVDSPPAPGWTGYTVAKTALAAFARGLAAEAGPSGVTVNCVAPGMTGTSFIGSVPEKVQLGVARQTPLRRLAQPWDVAGAVAYLVSPDGAFVTGQTLRVNGGMDMR